MLRSCLTYFSIQTELHLLHADKGEGCLSKAPAENTQAAPRPLQTPAAETAKNAGGGHALSSRPT